MTLFGGMLIGLGVSSGKILFIGIGIFLIIADD